MLSSFKTQTNPRNPAPWETVKRYDGPGSGGPRHYNDVLEKYKEQSATSLIRKQKK